MPHLKRTVRRPWLPEHKPQSGRRHANTEFYRSAAWRKLRLVKLEQQPLCEECLKHDPGILRRRWSTTSSRSIGAGRPLDLQNLQSLCNSCHNRKSARERR